MVIIKEFVYEGKILYEFGCVDYDSGMIAVDEDDVLVAVLRDDQYAHEGLSISQLVEFLA